MLKSGAQFIRAAVFYAMVSVPIDLLYFCSISIVMGLQLSRKFLLQSQGLRCRHASFFAELGNLNR